MISFNLAWLLVQWGVGLTAALWLLFLAVMALKTARDNGSLPKVVLPFAYIILYVGLLVDFVVNITVATVLFLELPKEGTVTSRVSRHLKEEDGWRKKLAKFICGNFLDPFEIGGHCK